MLLDLKLLLVLFVPERTPAESAGAMEPGVGHKDDQGEGGVPDPDRRCRRQGLGIGNRVCGRGITLLRGPRPAPQVVHVRHRSSFHLTLQHQAER